ncbi:MAG: heparin lyase I family protein [Pseudomonadota bacterium]
MTVASRLAALALLCLAACATGGAETPTAQKIDFDDGTFGTLSANDKGAGAAPFSHVPDGAGGRAAAITVARGDNPDRGAEDVTERAELALPAFDGRRGETWFGFRVRAAPGFPQIDDRLVFAQLKHQIREARPSPLVALRIYDEGRRLKIGGQVGPDDKYGASFRLKNGRYVSRRSDDPRLTLAPEAGPPVVADRWTTYLIGAQSASDGSGWIEVWRDGARLLRFDGATFDWPHARFKETVARIGPYRDAGPAPGHPPQTLIYDDVALAATRADLEAAMGTKPPAL